MLGVPERRRLAVGRERCVVVVLAPVALGVVAGHAAELHRPASAASDACLVNRAREIGRRAGEGEDGGKDAGQHREPGQEQDQRPDARTVRRRAVGHPSRTTPPPGPGNHDGLVRRSHARAIRLGEEGPELRGKRLHRREAVSRVLCHRPPDRSIEPRRDLRAVLPDARRGLVDVPHRNGDEVLAGERNLARQQLVEHRAERVDIAAVVHRTAARLLGRDVVARPQHRPGLGQASVDFDRAGDPEVRHLRPAVLGQEHVLRLDVAMDEPVRVREREPVRNLQCELDRSALRQRRLALDQRLQVLPLDVLEDDELAAVLLAAVDDRDDVRVRELRREPRLAAEPLDVVAVAHQLLVHDLQRDVALEQRVLRPIDAGHAAGPDELLQLVAFRDQLADHAWIVPVLPEPKRAKRREPAPRRSGPRPARDRRSQAASARGCSSSRSRT